MPTGVPGRGVETRYQDAHAHKNRRWHFILPPEPSTKFMGWRVVNILNKPTILDNCFEPPTT